MRNQKNKRKCRDSFGYSRGMKTTANNASVMNNETKTYPGQHTSALRRVRLVMKRAGWNQGKVTGRYQPFCNEQVYYEGIAVHRVGCGRNVALHWVDVGPGAKRKAEWLPDALVILRAAGLPFDDRGWMRCES